MKRVILFFIAECFSIGLFAQYNADSLEKKYNYVKWPVKKIIGEWVTDDSTCTKIEFIRSGNEIIIVPAFHVGNYTFQVEGDSISASGFAVNWPPYYCILLNVDTQTLKTIFYDYMGENATQVNYIKMDE